MKKFVIIILFILGIVFRFWLTSAYPQPFAMDQENYTLLAHRMQQFPNYVDTNRPYGYSLIIAVLYIIFGQGNILMIRIFQVILDTATALLVLGITKELFREKKPVFLSYIFYLFNPYTAAYSGVILTEVTAVFLTALVFFLALRIYRKINIALLFLLGLILGFTPQVRPMLQYFCFSIMLLMLVNIYQKIKHRLIRNLTIIFFSLFFITPFLYNVIGNRWYHQSSSIMQADNMMLENFYISLFQERFLMTSEYFPLPKEVVGIYMEYSAPKKNQQERTDMTNKYINLSIRKIKSAPFDFVRTRFAKMWYVWEKHFFFYFPETGDRLNPVAYVTNLIVLSLALIGFILLWLRSIKGKGMIFRFLIMVTVFLIIISIVLAFSTAEERYTLPAYPLVFIFMGYTVGKVCDKFKFHRFA